MELLILIPTELERQGICKGSRHEAFPVALSGVGQVAAAANTARLIRALQPQAILLMGICGAYEGSGLKPGDLVRVDDCFLADFGAFDRDGAWLGAQSLGLGPVRWSASDPADLPDALADERERLCALRGVTSASVQSVSGTDALATLRFAGGSCQIEEMEGAGVCAVAAALGIPVYHVRAVSNRAGLRDRSSWKISEALQALEGWWNTDE